MQNQLTQAFSLVSQTDNMLIKRGQHLLAMLKRNNAYPLILLQYMSNPNINQIGKLRAAIELRLWCEYFKNLEEFEKNIYNQFIEDIKQYIIINYLTFSLKISKTLRPGIICLADSFFPHSWKNLVPILMNYSQEFPNSTTAVLKLIQNLTYKYTYSSRSDPLYQEIILVCDQFHDYFLLLTEETLRITLQNPNDLQKITILEILMKIFYNLNYQDIHPKFEDNLPKWMNILKTIMSLNNSNENVFKCKGASLESILLYATKYKEDVEQPIKSFCQEIWSLCADASEDQQYDQVVFSCLKFFKSLIVWNDMKGFFNENMSLLISKLILPNIGITKTSIALFEEEIDVYIDYYFRNTQLQTRRAAALELLRTICRFYGSFEPYLKNQLQNFHNLADKNIIAECTILNLTIDGGTKGFRDTEGCTSLHINQDIITYCYFQIAKLTLQGMYQYILNTNGDLIQKKYNTIHVATIIRFLFYFRIYIPVEDLASILEFLTSINTNNQSLQKVIYLAINGFIIIKHGDFLQYKELIPYFNSNNISSIAERLFKFIYEANKRQPSLNESLTKMFFNVTKKLDNKNADYHQYQIEIVKQMLLKTSNYDFTCVQFLFESIGIMTYWYNFGGHTCKDILEGQIFHYFNISLKNKSDLINFCLQILAINIQLQKSSNSQYQIIYNSLLDSQNWNEDNQSIMSSYIHFIISYIKRYKQRLRNDKPAIEIILSKIIQIDHFQLFVRFIDAIVNQFTLSQFFQSGYCNLAIQGSQVIAKTSIQGKKASLLLICKLMSIYNQHQLLNCVIMHLFQINNCSQGYFEDIIAASLEIVRTISNRSDRKYIFFALCSTIANNYFQNIELIGGVLNALISNTTDRFNFRNMTQHSKDEEIKGKKEAAYVKLQIFQKIDKIEAELKMDEDELLLKAFNYISSKENVINLIQNKNRQRIARLNQKYSR